MFSFLLPASALPPEAFLPLCPCPQVAICISCATPLFFAYVNEARITLAFARQVLLQRAPQQGRPGARSAHDLASPFTESNVICLMLWLNLMMAANAATVKAVEFFFGSPGSVRFACI